MSKITLYTLQQMKQDGSAPIIGGAERYMWDIAALMRDMGHEVEFFQNGTYDWAQKYNGFDVRAFKMLDTFERTASDLFDVHSADKVFYSWYGQMGNYKYEGVCVSHGVWFDVPNFYTMNELRDLVNPVIRRALSRVNTFVSVDTNFINYCRTAMSDLELGKMKYIPNYVDTSEFYPMKKTVDRDAVTILYPRRLDRARGIKQAMEIADLIMGMYSHVRFNFAIDRNVEEYWNEFVEWANGSSNRSRITYGTYNFSDMKTAYRQSDIVMIPTQWAEGTSLSCLEAMAMGKPVVSTVVGGLGNLVLNRYNGLLVGTDVGSIFDGVKELVEDKKLRRSLGENAIKTAQAFSKERWKQEWSKVIQKVY